MPRSARQAVFEGMEILPDGLRPFVTKRLEVRFQISWQQEVIARFPDWRPERNGKIALDTQKLLKIMERFWNDVFRNVLDRTHRSIVNELVDVRNKLAHDEPFSYDDAERALDSMRRLLEAVGAAPGAEKIGAMRDTILRTKYRELARNEERKAQTQSISTGTLPGLLPWREVVEPHKDVATGDFLQAEFAADLDKVHRGKAPAEYRDPREFFSRTYLTDGLGALLQGAAKRLYGKGGDPVVELQTNFGGGKTHSMLALYHMAGGTSASHLPGLDQLLSEQKLEVPAGTSRAVLVGTSRGPNDPFRTKDGVEIRTTWGELAWQLGGQDAYRLIADNDASGIAPGSRLLEQIFGKCAPSLILIDEWIAYLRQIYGAEGLPSGSFDANLSFVQALTEAVKASPRTLLVASLPASQIEVGGQGGQEALSRLKQTFSRLESSWRPASQEESYEIVRRRLFKEIPGQNFKHRDNAVKQFAKLYQENASDFPQGSAEGDYRRRLEKAYPIHPDLFDHLYTVWGSLEEFQRTRGVLRLMAQVIHQLWMSRDPSIMIMPGSVAIDSQRVEPELLRYLREAWQGIIAGDVEGENSTPYQIDRSAPNLNRYSATQRVARTVFFATAPAEGQQNPGIDDKRINLGVVQPGERVASFGDALRRLANQARFMHSELGRHWYSMTPSLNRMAADRAREMEEKLVLDHIHMELRKYFDGQPASAYFDDVKVAPEDSSDIPDESGGIRAVILGIDHPHAGRNGSDSEAMNEARNILNHRGATPRVYRNTLVFLAADNRQTDSLVEAMRHALAWDGIVRDADSGRLDMKSSDIALAKSKRDESLETARTRLRETWCHLIHPFQESPVSEVEFASARIPVQDGVLGRAGKKLVSAGALMTEIGPENLNHALEKYIWQDKPHLNLGDVWEYLNRHIYLPRLAGQETLIGAVRRAISDKTPGPFAYARKWDELEQVYVGLTIENFSDATVIIDGESALLRKEVAESNRPEQSPDDAQNGTDSGNGKSEPKTKEPTEPTHSTHFAGRVALSSERPVEDMERIVEGVVKQITGLKSAEITLTLEIEAKVESGLDKSVIRTLLENAEVLRFSKKTVR